MKRHQVFAPEDLSKMGKVFHRASLKTPGERQRTLLAKAIVITYRPKASETALAAAALHLVGLDYLN